MLSVIGVILCITGTIMLIASMTMGIRALIYGRELELICDNRYAVLLIAGEIIVMIGIPLALINYIIY